MEKFLKNLQKNLIDLTTTALTFLCLGVIIQLLINDTILGWDPVGNIKNAGNAFIGVIAIILLYILFVKRPNKN